MAETGQRGIQRRLLARAVRRPPEGMLTPRVKYRMQRISGLCPHADIRSKWWCARARPPSYASGLCDHVPTFNARTRLKLAGYRSNEAVRCFPNVEGRYKHSQSMREFKYSSKMPWSPLVSSDTNLESSPCFST